MAYDDDNERQHPQFPKHLVAFSGWTVPIDLRSGVTGITGATGVPAKPATTLTIGNNSQLASETGQVTIATLGGQTGQAVVVPPLSVITLNGHFTHLLARGGTGLTGMYAIAQWAD